MSTTTTGISRAAAVLALLVLLGGCAMFGPSDPVERAQTRWDALLERDWDTAYAYLSPGTRKVMTREAYGNKMKARSVNWRSAQAEPTECDPANEVCEIRVKISYSVRGGVPGLRRAVTLNRVLTEQWVFADGGWYFVPDRLR